MQKILFPWISLAKEELKSNSHISFVHQSIGSQGKKNQHHLFHGVLKEKNKYGASENRFRLIIRHPAEWQFKVRLGLWTVFQEKSADKSAKAQHNVAIQLSKKVISVKQCGQSIYSDAKLVINSTKIKTLLPPKMTEYVTKMTWNMRHITSQGYEKSTFTQLYWEKWYSGLFHHMDHTNSNVYLSSKSLIQSYAKQVFMSSMHLVVELFVAPMGPNQYKKFQQRP